MSLSGLAITAAPGREVNKQNKFHSLIHLEHMVKVRTIYYICAISITVAP